EVARNDVRILTPDQLDQAFQDGIVTETTRVWQDGMPCAVSLGELLGGGDDEDPVSDPTPHVPYAQQHYAQAEYAQQHYAQAEYAQQHYAQAEYAPQQYAQAGYAHAQ